MNKLLGTLLVMLLVSVGGAEVNAQTTTPTTTPGTPSTGSGGAAAENAVLLATAALVALGSGVFLRGKLVRS